MSHYLSGPPLWAGFLRVLSVLLLGALLAGCQSPREALQQLADAHGRQLEILPGQPFPLAMLPPQKTTKAPVCAYTWKAMAMLGPRRHNPAWIRVRAICWWHG